MSRTHRSPDGRLGVLQMVDTLEAGGAERVAVNLANLLPRDRFRSYLCTTRREGVLAELVAPDVGRLALARKRRLDFAALGRLRRFVREEQVDIIHAHGASLFFAALASFLPACPSIVWHDHFGRYAVEERPVWLYKKLASRARGVIAVNEPLAQWSIRKLGRPASRVWYVPNFVADPPPGEAPADLPGQPDKRIVCVANLRPQKDHLTLVAAMSNVTERVPDAHLLLVGSGGDSEYRSQIEAAIAERSLQAHVTLLGQRLDVAAIMRACAVGVLSSRSEGLPLALIEYGMSGLAALATRVGQCGEVLDDGRAGMLVPPGEPPALADALVALLVSPERRAHFAEQLHARVEQAYSARVGIEQVARIYDIVAGRPARELAAAAAN